MFKNFTYKGLKITKANDGWYVYYVIIFPNGAKEKRREFGKRYNISLANRNIQDAEDLLFDVKKDLENGIDPLNRIEILKEKIIQNFSEKISFDKAIELMKNEKGWVNPDQQQASTSSKTLSFLYNYFKPFLIEIKKVDDVREITRSDIKVFLEENFNRKVTVAPAEIIKKVGRPRNKNGWSATSTDQNKQKVSGFFSVLLNLDLIDIHPVIGIKIKKDNEKIEKLDEDSDFDRFEPWTQNEVDTYFQWLKDPNNWGSVKNKTKLPIELNILCCSALIYYAFIRKTELLRLKPEMIDWDAEVIRIPAKITKNKRRYGKNEIIRVDMPNNLIEILKLYFSNRFPNGANAGDFLLYRKDPKIQYSYSTFTTHFKEVRQKLQGIFEGQFVDKNQYALKHSGAIKMYWTLRHAGAPPAEIQTAIMEHCRHKDWNETANYLRRKLHIDIDENRKKVNF